MIILKEIITKDFHLELFAVQHSFRDNFNINDAFYRCNSFVFMVRFNLFRDVKVAGVASFYKLSFSQDVYRNKSFERFWLPKSVEDEKNVLMMQYWNQQLIKPNSHARFLRNESISEILYFGARRPLKKEYKLWTQPLQICLHAVWTTGCRSSFKKYATLLGNAILPIRCTRLFIDQSITFVM